MIDDCIQCPFCLVKSHNKKMAEIVCSSLDRIVGLVSKDDVKIGIAKFPSPEDCLLRKETINKN